MLINVFILLVLLLIFIQDIKYRFVYWILFPVLILLFITGAIIHHEAFLQIGTQFGFNVAFLLLQLLILSAYFSFKQKKLVNLTQTLLGWGDILFLVSVAFYFSFLNFLVFYIGSLTMVLIIWTISQSVSENKKIPLAGLQAMTLILFLVCNWLIFHVDPSDDYWLQQFLYK
jgi:hypothetical protein